MGGFRRATRIVRKGLTGLGILLLALGVFFTQTPWGRQLVLREILERVEGAFRGEITVEGISSPGLLRGFTFRGVRILGEDGRPFLVADSLMAGLSTRPLLRGDLVFTRVTLWAPEVRIERLPHQERMNVVAIFAPGPDPDAATEGEVALEEEASYPPSEAPLEADTERPGEAPPDQRDGGRTVAFHGIRIHGGTVHIVLPSPPQGLDRDRALVEIAPDGTSLLRRLSFREIELNLGEAVVLSPELDGERFQVESASLRGEVWPDPFRVEGLRGEVRREPGHLVATIEEARLPSSQVSGLVEVGWGEPDGAWVSVQGESQGLALGDLHWLEPRLPRGVARGPFELEMGRRGLLLQFPGTTLSLAQGSLRARGGLRLASTIGLENLALTLDGVDLDVVDPWLATPLPLEGLVDGELSLAGNPAALHVDGNVRLTRRDSTGTTDALVFGTFHLGDSLGVTGLDATLAPLDWGTFAELSPGMTLSGPGALRMEANGYLSEGIDLHAEVTHVPARMTPSRVTAAGAIRRAGGEVFLDLDGELSPLSFTSLRRFFRDLPLSGEVSGPVSLRGSLSALTVQADLATSAGPLRGEVRFDARHPAQGYAVDSEFQEFLLSNLVPAFPDPTRLTGRLVATGRGFSPEDLQGEVTANLTRGEIGPLRVDSAALEGRVEGGLVQLDALMAETGVGRVSAEGTFGLSSTAAPGELEVRLESESLEGLRPFLMGEVPVILDDLTPFDRDLLVVEGVNLDTIPTAAQVAVGGRVQASGTLRGGLPDFSAEGTVDFQELRLRTDYVEAGSFEFTAGSLPGDDARVRGMLRTDSILIRDLSFTGGEAEVDLGRTDGRVRVMAAGGGGEEYRARGSFALDSPGQGSVNLDVLDLRLDTIRWNLGGPTSFAWSPDGVQVRDFRLIRPGAGRMRVQADGFLPFRGEADFQLEIQELPLRRVARITQMDDVLEGLLDFRVRITGTAESPSLEGSLSGDSLRYGQLTLSGLDSEFSYQAGRLQGEAWASEGGRQVLAIEGALPADFRLNPEGSRLPEGPVDVAMAVDSFPVALALVVLEGLEEVEGRLSGQVTIGGTPRELAPRGTARLADGSVFIPALGVRYRDVQADFGLNPDGSVEVDGSLRSRGTARITGTVTLHPLTDPTLDLMVDATDLLAVARRDVQARLSGQVEVLQSYRRPRVQGVLTLEQGVLMVEELARSAEVVDLSDPSFMDVVEQGTTLRPILRASQNPFLQNLMLSVEVDLARDSWLRGRDLNVEMGGELQVFWDRTERDLALVGDLQAIRGVYTVLGRQFQVQEGEVRFLGTPGVNPSLDIQALHRLQTLEDERLDIIATVGGTLLDPRVSLSSTTSFAIAESDLVSYLIFGRPTYALASGQSRFAQGAAGSLLGAATGAGTNLALGTISSQLGTVVARDFGLDFLAISQAEYGDFFGSYGLAGTVATTQVEIGQYITDDVFAALMWRPLNSLGATSQDQFAGLRVEWRLADVWTLEGFIEDRFARSPLFAFSDLYRGEKIKGFFFWREWGY
jgi:autotransporter translocation and assembly factor TamB